MHTSGQPCVCATIRYLAWRKPPSKKLSQLNGGNSQSVTPLGHVLWNFLWFSSIPGSYLKRMVKSSGWLVLKTRDFYFYPQNVTALSKLCPERLPAMSWIRRKTSGNPVFKTPGRYISLIRYKTDLQLGIYNPRVSIPLSLRVTCTNRKPRNAWLIVFVPYMWCIVFFLGTWVCIWQCKERRQINNFP